MNADKIKQERDDLDQKLAQVSDLVCALEVVAWQLAQQSLEGEQASLRDAVVGISRCLAREVK